LGQFVSKTKHEDLLLITHTFSFISFVLCSIFDRLYLQFSSACLYIFPCPFSCASSAYVLYFLLIYHEFSSNLPPSFAPFSLLLVLSFLLLLLILHLHYLILFLLIFSVHCFFYNSSFFLSSPSFSLWPILCPMV
jgi:hypothetical protein